MRLDQLINLRRTCALSKVRLQHSQILLATPPPHNLEQSIKGCIQVCETRQVAHACEQVSPRPICQQHITCSTLLTRHVASLMRWQMRDLLPISGYNCEN